MVSGSGQPSQTSKIAAAPPSSPSSSPRKIDFGGNNDEHHPDRQDAGDGRLPQQVRNITRALK
jgi:hypothetical protein